MQRDLNLCIKAVVAENAITNTALRTNTDIFYCLKPTAFYYTQHLAVINIEVSPAPSPRYITSPYKALQQSLAAKRLILQENYPLITVQSFPLLSYVS